MLSLPLTRASLAALVVAVAGLTTACPEPPP